MNRALFPEEFHNQFDESKTEYSDIVNKEEASVEDPLVKTCNEHGFKENLGFHVQ